MTLLKIKQTLEGRTFYNFKGIKKVKEKFTLSVKVGDSMWGIFQNRGVYRVTFKKYTKNIEYKNS